MRGGSQTRASGRAHHARFNWRAFARFAALFAILVQTFVVQTHVHTAGEAGGSNAQLVQWASHGAAHASPSVAAPGAQHDDCVLCQTLAMSGASVLAAASSVSLSHDVSISLPLAALELVAAPPAHSWQSRAPPILL